MQQRSELPEGWVETPLKEITIDVKNFDPKKMPNQEFKYIDISSIDNRSYKIVTHKTFLGKEAPSRARRPILTNDVLFSNVRTYLKNIAIVEEDYCDQLCSTGISVLRSKAILSPKYLFFYVQTENFIDSVTPQQRGSQYPATSEKVVRKANIPLPPLAEQHRIVAAIEALFARLDATEARLARVPEIMKQFRQSVLAAACEGRLTEDWRVENNDIADASIIIDEIKQSLKNKFVEMNNLKDDDDVFILPEGWMRVPFGSIIKNFDGKRIPLKKDDRKVRQGIYPYYGASGIIDYIEDYLFDGKYLLISEDGANLVARSTPIAFIAEGKFWVNNHAHVVQPHGNILLEYISIIFNEMEINHYITGSAQPKLTQSNLNKIPIPLPPLPEQEEIVRRVDALLAYADQIEARVTATQERTEELRQSILEQAFSGRLVPQLGGEGYPKSLIK